MIIENSVTGRIFYGLHFCPGVAEYKPEGEEPFRVYLSSDALRAMDPSFAGKPVFLQHVEDDDIPDTIDEARKEADGWVIESFYNQADGKHWAKFMLLTQRSIDAVEKRGWTLSNAYRRTKSLEQPGEWNGVEYQLEIQNGEYRHLGVVPNPRYESMVLTPEQFAKYNKDKLAELAITNDDGKGEEGMAIKLNIFKRQKVDKVDNAADLDQLEIELPKSKKTVTIMQLVNAMDHEAGKPIMANMAHHLQMGDKTMSVGDFLALHNKMSEEHEAMRNEYEEFKSKHENNDDEFGEATKPAPVSASNADEEDEEHENEEDEEKEEKKEEKKHENSKDKKKKLSPDAKKRADDIRNAREKTMTEEQVVIETSQNQLERGRQEYGSGH